MPIPTIDLDCAELDDDDLNELSDFLAAHSAVKTFGASVMVDTETPDEIEENSPIIMKVTLTVKEWNAVTQGVGGHEAAFMAGMWLSEQLEQWSKERELSVRYDPEFNLIEIQACRQ